MVSALGLSSCSSQAYLLRDMGDPPGPGTKTVSPALAGRFFTTEPPGTPYDCFFCGLTTNWNLSWNGILELIGPHVRHTGQLGLLQHGLDYYGGELVCNIYCFWCQKLYSQVRIQEREEQEGNRGAENSIFHRVTQ